MAEPNVTAHGPADPTQLSWLKEIYNRQTGEILGRAPKLWLYIILYTLVLVLCLVAFTLLVLHIALKVVAANGRLQDNIGRLTTDREGRRVVGLSVAPSLRGDDAIHYTAGDVDSYRGYIEALDSLMELYSKARSPGALGPCGARPYGYGQRPCVFVKLNKRVGWRGTPLNASSDPEVSHWISTGGRIWLRCAGRDPWDREHLQLAYHPDPPGFDPGEFPVNMSAPAPMLAVQVVRYTVGVALTVACELFSVEGYGRVEFELIVTPR